MEISENTNKRFFGLFIIYLVGLSMLYNLTGCQGGGDDKFKNDMKFVMESYIDSVEDDFGSYNFENLDLDTMFWSDFLYWKFSNKTEFSNFALREEYRKKLNDRLKLLNENPFMGNIGNSEKLTELYRTTYLQFDSMYRQDINDWYNMKLNTSNDSIQYVKLRLHYKVKNKFNSTIKRTCVFSVRSGKILNRYIEDGFILRDSIIGIGQKHFKD